MWLRKREILTDQWGLLGWGKTLSDGHQENGHREKGRDTKGHLKTMMVKTNEIKDGLDCVDDNEWGSEDNTPKTNIISNEAKVKCWL